MSKTRTKNANYVRTTGASRRAEETRKRNMSYMHISADVVTIPGKDGFTTSILNCRRYGLRGNTYSVGRRAAKKERAMKRDTRRIAFRAAKKAA